jgi:hypothetical protein
MAAAEPMSWSAIRMSSAIAAFLYRTQDDLPRVKPQARHPQFPNETKYLRQ